MPPPRFRGSPGILIRPGQSLQIVMAPPAGTYLYICRRKGHANMTGTLIVEQLSRKHPGIECKGKLREGSQRVLKLGRRILLILRQREFEMPILLPAIRCNAERAFSTEMLV